MDNESAEEWYLIRGDELRKLYAAKAFTNAKTALDNIYKPLEYIENPRDVTDILAAISKRKVVGVPSNIAKKDTKNYNKGQFVGNYESNQ